MNMVTSPQCSQNGVGVNLEKGWHVVDNLVVRFYLDDQEVLVVELYGDLVHGEWHLVDVKDCDSWDSW